MSEELVVNELGDDDFKDEKDWELIRPLELLISSKPDDDDVYDVYYKLGDDDGRLCSEVRDEDMDEGEIQDIADIMFPIFHNIKHKRRVVPIEANFLVGYVGENIKSDNEGISIFAFPLFWNGTIDNPDRVDLRNDITIDLTQPVGKYIMELESGGEEWDVDEYDLEDRQRIIQQSFSSDDYKLEFNKGTDVIKIIDKVFTKPEEISIKQGEVQMYNEEGKARLNRHRKKFNETFEAIKDRLKILQKKPVIRSSDLKQIKDMLPELTYSEIDDDFNKYSTRDRQIRDGMKDLFNIVLAKLRKQKETASIKKEPEPEPISREQDLLNQLDKVKKLLGDAMVAYKQATTIQNTRDVNKYKLQAIELAKLLKEERERGGGSIDNPKLYEKTGGKVVALGVPKVRQNLTLQAEKIPKQDDIWKWSNPEKVAEMAKKYLGDMAVVFRSTKPKKKYMIFDPDNKKWVFFGEMNFEDFTKHQDPKRRDNYLTRTAGIKGNWKNNRYSANNLSREILW